MPWWVASSLADWWKSGQFGLVINASLAVCSFQLKITVCIAGWGCDLSCVLYRI